MNKRAMFCLAIVLLSIGLVGSCQTAAPDSREELTRALKGANIEGFNFATSEDETRTVTSWTRGGLGKFVTLDSKTTSLILRYTSVKEKGANTTRTYKTEVAKSGTGFDFLISDLANGEVVVKTTFPVVDPNTPDPLPTSCGGFESCCEFDCKKLPALQQEANRTCETRIVGVICCLNDGGLISKHILITPNSPRCRFKDLIPDIEGFLVNRG